VTDDVIVAERLTKSYGSTRGVTDLSFVVHAGEVFGYLGLVPRDHRRGAAVRPVGAVADVAAACVMFLLLGLTFGSMALAVGCISGRRTWAIAPTVSTLSWARPLSPFRWYLDPDPLTNGVHAENVLVLAALTALFTAVPVWGFRRRDLVA
jgi:hypothetical protein